MNFKNLALGYVATAPSPATTGTSLVLDSGEGARFPQPSTDGNFYVTAMPPGENPNVSNSEILQVTARSTDTLTIVREQGDTTAKTIEAGWIILQSIYKENILDEDDMASDSATALATQRSIKAMHDTGWTAITETLTYASATTITVAAGAASRYQKGDKLKLTQTTDNKYFYIVKVEDELLTITGGSDYTLVNAAITSPQLSRIETPFGFPGWFNWTVSWQISGTMEFSATPTFAKFKISGRECLIHLYAEGTTSGTGTTNIRFKAPVNSAQTSGFFGSCFVRDSSRITGILEFAGSGDSTQIRVYKDDFSNYGIGSNRGMGITISYSI